MIKTRYLGLSTLKSFALCTLSSCGFHVNYLVQEEASEMRVK